MTYNSKIFNFTDPEESSGYLLWQLTMLWQRKMKKELEKIDLTHTQFVLLAALAWLSETGKVVTQVDISNHAKTDRMMTSKVLRTLQEKGFINRTEHLTDTRAKSVIITELGNRAIRKATKIVDSVDLSFFSSVDTKELNRSMIQLSNNNQN